MVIISIVILILFCWFIGCIPNKKPTKLDIYAISSVMILLAGFRGPGVDNDYSNYLDMYNFPPIVVEPSFSVICFIARSLGLGVVGLFLIYAILGVSLKIKAIKEISPLFWFSIAIYLSNIYILHDLNQIRAGVSSAIILLMIKPIYDRNFTKFILLFFAASFFHYSGLMTIILYPLLQTRTTYRERLFWTMLPFIGYLLFYIISSVNIFSLIPIENVRLKLEMYKKMQEAGVEGSTQINLFNLHTIFRLGIFLFLISKFNFLNQKIKYFPILIKTYSLALFFFPFFGAITPLLGYRVSELFGVVEIILYPLIFYLFTPAIYSKVLIIFVSLLLFAIDVFYKQYLFF